MSIKGVILFILGLVIAYILILYIRIEVSTMLYVDEFKQVSLPEDLTEKEISYRKVFSINSEAQLLYKFTNGDQAFVYFRADKSDGDDLEAREERRWEYENHEYTKKPDDEISNWTWPPYI